MPESVKVLLIEDNRMEATQTLHWLGAAPGVPFEAECLGTLQDGVNRLAHGGIDIVLLDLNLPDSRGLDTFTALQEQAPQVPIVVLTGEYDESIGPSAVENGAQDYLVKQQANAATLNRVLRHAIARSRVKQARPAKAKQVIAFIGAKGGVGTTTTALNIALALAMQGKPVILVELRPTFGTLSSHLQGKPKANLRNLLDLNPNQIGVKELDATLCQGQAGLRILFGPQEVNESKEIDPLAAQAIVKGLSQMVDTLVLDLPCQPSPATEAAVRLSSFIAVVVEREPTAVAAGKTMVAQLQQWGEGGGIIGAMVVNRTIYPVPVEFGEIQAGMGCPVVGVVPWAATACLRAIREGAPLVVGQRENEAAFAFSDMAAKLAANKLVALHL